MNMTILTQLSLRRSTLKEPLCSVALLSSDLPYIELIQRLVMQLEAP